MPLRALFQYPFFSECSHIISDQLSSAGQHDWSLLKISEIWRHYTLRSKSLTWNIYTWSSGFNGALPLSDWIRGIGFSSRSKMPIKGNGQQGKLQPFLIKLKHFEPSRENTASLHSFSLLPSKCMIILTGSLWTRVLPRDSGKWESYHRKTDPSCQKLAHREQHHFDGNVPV